MPKSKKKTKKTDGTKRAKSVQDNSHVVRQDNAVFRLHWNGR